MAGLNTSYSPREERSPKKLSIDSYESRIFESEGHNGDY